MGWLRYSDWRVQHIKGDAMRLIGAFVLGLILSFSEPVVAQTTPDPAAPPQQPAPSTQTQPAAGQPASETVTGSAKYKIIGPKIVDENIGTNLHIRPDEEYVKPTWTNLVRAMIRANALDIMNDDRLVDEYAAISECEIYQQYYHNDFEWNKVRKKFRDSIALNKDTFPERFHYDAEVQLNRYDFATSLYHFRDRSVIKRANVFGLFDGVGAICEEDAVKAIPRKFRAVLNDPISIYGLSMNQKDAEELLNYMETIGNTDHILYLTFDMTIKYMLPLRKEIKDITTGMAVYAQPVTTDKHDDFRMDAVLDQVRFYADPKRTVLVYTLKP